MVRLRLLDGGNTGDDGSPTETTDSGDGLGGPTQSVTVTEVLFWITGGWWVAPTHVPVQYGSVVGCSCKEGPACTQVGKHPRTKNGITDATRDPEQAAAWWRRWPGSGIAGATALDRDGKPAPLIVVDLDHGKYSADDRAWLETYYKANPTRRHRTGGGGYHLIWLQPPGSAAKSGQNVGGHRGVDLRVGRQSYILLPPSPHQSGHRYSIKSNREIAVATPELEQWLYSRPATPGTKTRTGAKTRTTAYSVHSMLTDLLSDPPGGPGDGRNEWLTKVGGHYAKRFRGQRDAYDWHMRQASALCGEPLEDAEYGKVVESVWRTETANHPERGLSDANGWLQAVPTDHQDWPSLVTAVRKSDGEEMVEEVEAICDFVPEVLGVMNDIETHVQQYWVRLHRQPSAGPTIEVMLEASTLGDGRATSRWLARYGCTIAVPKNRHPGTMTVETMLQRFLLSQGAAVTRLTGTLGWDPDALDGQGGFVTPDAVLTADGPVTFDTAGVRPNPVTSAGATYRYGTQGGLQEARQVLAQVLEFQAENVVSVFGAWWAACLLKPQLMAATSLFPICAIEATSESGKTNGFFGLMIQLNGNTGGATVATAPSLRNMAAHSRSGIVWIDDADDVSRYTELIRSATGAGTFTKMNLDRSAVESFRVEAPLVFSGEGLGLNGQKALIDRVVLIDQVPSPKGRVNLAGQDQWADVETLKARYVKVGGLSAVAGSLQIEALRWSDQAVAYLREMRKTALRNTGRRRDTFATLLAGAWLLEKLLGLAAGQDVHTGLVKAWVAEQDSRFVGDADNTLTQSLVPWALRTFQYPDAPEENGVGGRYVGLDNPAFVEDSPQGRTVWVSAELLAQAWDLHRGGRVSVRTESAEALAAQAQATGARSVRKRIVGTGRGGRRAYYYRLPLEYSSAVLRRAQGGD